MPKNRIFLEIYDQFIAPFILMLLFPSRVICLNSIVPLFYPFRIDLFFQMRMFYFVELDSFSKKVKNWLGVLSAKRASNLYCASIDHANDMTKRLNLKKRKVKVIHLGFNFDFDTSISTTSRSNKLLFVSVIRPYKNLHGLIEAVLKAKERRPDLPIELDIIGRPADYIGIEDYMDSIYSTVADSRFKNIVNFLGSKSHNEVIEKFSACKAMVFPTLFEGFGLPLLEGMATRTPVISSSVNSLPEISKGTTLLYDVNNNDSLVNLIISLYDEGYPNDLIESAYERSKKFSWYRATEALINNCDFIVE